MVFIEPLVPDRLDDFLSFFESVRFTENPHWSKCYCYSFHFTGSADQWTTENNRLAVSRLVKDRQMKGYLAYLNGRPVGWCNANNRLNYQRLHKIYELPQKESNKICSIVCFLIHPDFRRRGISRQLLHRVESDYTAPEYEIIEAYPGKGDLSCERLYKGPLEMYLGNGFHISEEHSDYRIVRKDL